MYSYNNELNLHKQMYPDRCRFGIDNTTESH